MWSLTAKPFLANIDIRAVLQAQQFIQPRSLVVSRTSANFSRKQRERNTKCYITSQFGNTVSIASWVSVTFSTSSKDFSCWASAKRVITNNNHSFLHLIKYLSTVQWYLFNVTKFLYISPSILSKFVSLYDINAQNFFHSSISLWLFPSFVFSLVPYFELHRRWTNYFITSYSRALL